MTHEQDDDPKALPQLAARLSSDAHQRAFTWRILDIGDDLVSVSVHGHQVPGVSVQHQPPDRKHTHTRDGRRKKTDFFFNCIFIWNRREHCTLVSCSPRKITNFLFWIVKP